MRNFGFSGYDTVVSLGTNAKMNEMSAALGLTMLESLDALMSVNRENYDLYKHELTSIEGIRLLDYKGSEQYHNMFR